LSSRVEAPLPAGRWFRVVTSRSERGNAILSGADDKPLVVRDRVGEGRVAELLSDHLWLWNRGIDGGGPQPELVRRIAHWLRIDSQSSRLGGQ